MAIIQAVEYVKTMRPQLKSMSKNDEERRVKQEELTKLTNSKAYDQMTEKLERIDMTMNRLKLKEKDFADESFSVNNDTASLSKFDNLFCITPFFFSLYCHCIWSSLWSHGCY